MPSKTLVTNGLMIYQFLHNMYAHASTQYYKCYNELVTWAYDGVILYQSVYIPDASGAVTHVNLVNIDMNNKFLLLFALFCKIIAYKYKFQSIDEYFPIDNCVNVVVYANNGRINGKIDTTVSLANDKDINRNLLSDPLYMVINDTVDVLDAYFLFKDDLFNITTMTAMLILLNYATRFECKIERHTFETFEVLNESTMEKITLKVDDLMK